MIEAKTLAEKITISDLMPTVLKTKRNSEPLPVIEEVDLDPTRYQSWYLPASYGFLVAPR
jgi:hypothetical protein